MRRVLDFLLRNWPLKLAAILLATVLYSGLVLAQNVRTWTGQVPVAALRQPINATLVSELEPVTVIRYRAPLDIPVLGPTSFSASVDLSDVDAQPGGPPVSVPITLIALDQRIQIVDFSPREEQVQLDPVEERIVPITVELGTVPDGVKVGVQEVDPQAATLRGASSRVNSVSKVIARVAIDASALNVDRDVDLVAVDSNGNQVPSIEIDPPRAHVTIPVAQELATRTLPVAPQLTGVPAPGYTVTAVTVDPLTVQASGEAAVISLLQSAATAPIDISDRTNDLEAEVGLSLPDGIASDVQTVRVMITIAQETGTQSFGIGVALIGEQPGFGYVLSPAQVNVTLGGPTTGLSAIDPTQLIATADVAGLSPGDNTVDLVFQPPEGLQIVAIDPAQVVITVTPPPPTPSPSPTPAPATASPSASATQ